MPTESPHRAVPDLRRWEGAYFACGSCFFNSMMWVSSSRTTCAMTLDAKAAQPRWSGRSLSTCRCRRVAEACVAKLLPREAVVNTKVAEGFEYWVVTYLRHYVPELWSGEARCCAEAGAWHRLVKASSSRAKARLSTVFADFHAGNWPTVQLSSGLRVLGRGLRETRQPARPSYCLVHQ